MKKASKNLIQKINNMINKIKDTLRRFLIKIYSSKSSKRSISEKGKSIRIKKNTPLFLISTGRSGTTLLQRILNSCDDNYIWGEHGGFLNQIAVSYYLFSRNENNAKNMKLPEFKNPNSHIDLKNPEKWVAWTNKFSKEEQKNYYRTFITSFLKLENMDIDYWGFKEVRYCIKDDDILKLLLELFPEAKFLSIIRNPFEVIRSQIGLFDKSEKTNFLTRVENWKNQNQFIHNFFKDNPKSCFLIKFEELIDKKNDILKRLFSFLGLELSDKQIEVLNLEKGRGAHHDKVPYSEFFSLDEIKEINKMLSSTNMDYGYRTDISE